MRITWPWTAWLAARERAETAAREEREALAAERREERALFAEAIRGMTSVMEKSLDTAAVQARTTQAWLDSFKVDSTPMRVRSWDEAADDQRYIDAHLPAELQGLSQADQYHALVKKMDSFDLGV